MSLQDWSNLAASVAILVLAVNGWLVMRELERSRERLAALTRRVWTLEGCPECDCCKQPEGRA